MITQKELKEVLHYDPSTGIFIWLINPAKNIKAGDIAGCKTRGYRHISFNNKGYRAHRLAWLYMTGKWPKNKIDHYDHIKDNNKWDNLFAATDQENQKNRSLNKNNKSGVTGVYWDDRDKKWRAQVKINGSKKHLGNFNDKFNAICARMAANNKYSFSENHGR